MWSVRGQFEFEGHAACSVVLSSVQLAGVGGIVSRPVPCTGGCLVRLSGPASCTVNEGPEGLQRLWLLAPGAGAGGGPGGGGGSWIPFVQRGGLEEIGERAETVPSPIAPVDAARREAGGWKAGSIRGTSLLPVRACAV